MKRVLRRPSPAMVIAIVALIAALGGTAIAGGVINKKKAKKVANNVVTQRAPGLSVASAKSADNATNATNSDALGGLSLRGLSMWVVLNSTSTGGVSSSSGGVTTTVLSAGRARVTFPNPVTNCAINANGGIVSPSDASNFAPGFVMVGRSSTSPNAVQYEVDDDTGTAIGTEPVYMTVQC